MTRSSLLAAVLVTLTLAAGGLSACGDDGGSAETLPPIRTTTTTSTTTTTISLEPVEYVVQPGETLAIIAERAGVTLAALCTYNELESCDYVQAGQTIVIPPADYVPPTTTLPPP